MDEESIKVQKDDRFAYRPKPSYAVYGIAALIGLAFLICISLESWATVGFLLAPLCVAYGVMFTLSGESNELVESKLPLRRPLK